MARTISAVLVVLLAAAAAVAGPARMAVQDGLVSATFDATPAPEALDVIRRATGVELVLPPAVEPKPLTLVVDQVPLEAFLRRVLAALDLAGFALVYAPDGSADRLIAVPPGHGRPSRVTAARSGTPAAEARNPSAPRRVPFLIRQAEAESIKLGSPGPTILPESRPSFTTATEACDGTLAEYPVQTVLIVSAGTTHVATLIVCAPGGLTPGEALVPRAAPGETGWGGDPAYVRYEARSP